MLVATFGPSTAWHGREIIWDADHFILAGHGGIPAAGLLDYDRQGQITWARPEYRMWAFQVDLWERGGVSSAPGLRGGPGAVSYAAGSGPHAAGGGPYVTPAAAPGARSGRRLPTWAIVLIVVSVVALILAVVAAVAIPAFVMRATDTLAHDMQVRSGVQSIQTAVESYAQQHGGMYPAAGDANAVILSRYISVWPTNPFTGLPMADGGGAGNYRYDVSSDGGAYRLIGYGRDGDELFELAGGSTDTV